MKENELDGQRAKIEETINTQLFCGKNFKRRTHRLETMSTLEDMSILYSYDSNCIQLAQNKTQFRASVNTEMNIPVTRKQLLS
jgi:hypothetical protein